MSLFERKTVYILRSDRNPQRHYTGVTADIAQRLRWHNAGQNMHTAQDRPWSVVVSIEFNNEETASKCERYLKSGSGRAFAAAMRPFATGASYLNFTPEEDRIRDAYGEDGYARLVAAKDAYDPGNLFRLNHNIRPSQPVFA